MTDKFDLPEKLHAYAVVGDYISQGDEKALLEIDPVGVYDAEYRETVKLRLLNRYNACAGLGDTVLPEGWVKRVVDLMRKGPRREYASLTHGYHALRDELEAAQINPATTVVSKTETLGGRIVVKVFKDGHIETWVDGVLKNSSPAGVVAIES